MNQNSNNTQKIYSSRQRNSQDIDELIEIRSGTIGKIGSVEIDSLFPNISINGNNDIEKTVAGRG